MSGLRALRGHEAARRLLARAALRGELPGSILLHGPAGIGKQRFGLWLGQLLLCDRPGENGPCGQCQSCRFALRLEHPDLQWFFPLARPKVSGGPDKLASALEEARAAELAARAASGTWIAAPGEPVGLFLAQVRTLCRMAASRPALAHRRVFLIGQAEYLASQEASQEAANALLKILEEPPPAVTLILTASDPDDLLPTIRSRLVPVALRPLPDAEVAAFLVEELGIAEEQARKAAALAQGAIGRALGFLPSEDGELGPLEAVRQRARALLVAAIAPQPQQRYAAALATSPTGARGAFAEVLDALAAWLRDLASTACGAEERLVNPDARDFLADLARRLPNAAAACPAAIQLVGRAAALAHGNVNPQLTLAWLLGALHRTLTGR
ncbi:MAG TPA: DNA polymerase III subunit delta' C-terminal domain-containing protein [Longimicrobiales bacterium]